MGAEKLNVDEAAQPRVEQQIPARMLIVVVNEYAVLSPAPVAAMRDIVRSYHPSGVIFQHDEPAVQINREGYIVVPDRDVTAMRVAAPFFNPLVVVIPVTMIVPIATVIPIATLISVVVLTPLASFAVFPNAMLIIPILAAVVPVLPWLGMNERCG
jgi:hypothetical protein